METIENILAIIGLINLVLTVIHVFWVFFDSGTEWIDNICIIEKPYKCEKSYNWMLGAGDLVGTIDEAMPDMDKGYI